MRKRLVEKGHRTLSIGKQCELLSLSRSSFYYAPKLKTQMNLDLMKLIDVQFLKTPFYGVGQMSHYLRNCGHDINPKRIRRLMRLMALMPIYQEPDTSKRHPEHRIYPYLLGKMVINRPNQVWCSDITYIPMRRGFLYLVAIMDWATRKVLAWRLSNTMDTGFCVEALEEAMRKYGKPEIFNMERLSATGSSEQRDHQGSQFTSLEFTGRLKDAEIKISMDGKGRYLDNIFIERLWRSLKYECVYLHAFENGLRQKLKLPGGSPFIITDARTQPTKANHQTTPTSL